MTHSPSSSSKSVWTARDLRGDPHAAKDKAERVRAMFAAIAPRYDLNNRIHSFGRDQAWRRRAVSLCRVSPDTDILDVACGTGDLSEAFARARPRSVVGVDFTEPMLALARRKAARRVQAADMPRPRYQLGDAMNLPFADATFDVVSIAFGLRNLAAADQALREFRRVLRPGGQLVVLEFGRPRQALFGALSRLYCQTLMPITASVLAGDRSGAYRYLPRSVDTFSEPGEIMRAIERAGFGDVSRHSMTFGICDAYHALAN